MRVTAGTRPRAAWAWPGADLPAATLKRVLVRGAGLPALELPRQVRLRRRGELTFALNYGLDPWQRPVAADDAVLGGANLTTQNLACWRS
jgi:beta-galactosidase